MLICLILKLKHLICKQVARLLYTNSGVGLLALAANAVQRLWKWSRNEQNPTGKVISGVFIVCIFLDIFVNEAK